MVESADEPPLSNSPHSWVKKTPFVSHPPPLHSPDFGSDPTETHRVIQNRQDAGHICIATAGPSSSSAITEQQDTLQQDPSALDKKRDGTQPAAIATVELKAPILQRFIRDVKRIIRSSWINWLLVFVPIGIVMGILVDWVHVDAISPSAVFAINAVAIIPLASLLAFATESVASKVGDTVGALMNVSFGNAVELIIFIIALVENQVRVVQAAALGSILSNLLLILGMAFVAGGLRYREQLYNSTVSQMSACLLCLSVISLLLPTAFHASFSDPDNGDQVVLKVSRGTSIVLLLVYGLYLLFSLKSHSFMYASTPQHLIDEESHPGLLTELLNSSSSSSDTSSSSSSDSDSSRDTTTTAKRIKRALRRKRRKSVSSSKDAASAPIFTRTPSDGTNATLSSHIEQQVDGEKHHRPVFVGEGVLSGDEADVDGEGRAKRRHSLRNGIKSRDFESDKVEDGAHSTISKRRRRKHRRARKSKREDKSLKDKEKEREQDTGKDDNKSHETEANHATEDSRQVVCGSATVAPVPLVRRPFNIKNISEVVRPAFNSAVFPHHEARGRPLAIPLAAIGPLTDARPSKSPGLRRTNSMPDMLHPTISHTKPVFATTTTSSGAPTLMEAQDQVPASEIVDTKEHLSQVSAITLLLVTTGLVALCAEFLVGSIDYLIANSGVSQAFIGLIILPIVGNAAEHVTAVTVAAKNKMDLAIGIALGSSIQIAIFVTPLMVILGWIMKTDMSLYFSLFETVSLFASAFIVGFLMIDGRSNYLEGALLIAAYTIIAVSAYFYPSCDLSSISGPGADGTVHCPN